ncbi:MAG: DegT/DnrJ/EryC1/StrS family aminotransferase [Neisseriaceae bacterium]|nr:DegT/DnrJ/EryC1/StrS family aminotransferase [Neisseriaceae bacterium]
MNFSFLPFAVPDIGEAEIGEVVDTLRSGWITTGPKSKKFEEAFIQYLTDEPNDIQALAVNSATSGLHLALEACGISTGDEVIIPTYTFTATAEVIRYLSAHPVFVDVDVETLNISPLAIRAAITSKTKAIIPVHIAGLSCNMSEIIAIAKEFNLKVIEDAAHALPTMFEGKKVGLLETDATVFSFYANKTMTTGEGGMLVSRHKEIIERAKIMRLHGISRDAFDRYHSKTVSWSYEVVAPGFKYNMPDILAAIGLQQLKRLPDFHIKRKAMAERYHRALVDLPLTLPFYTSLTGHEHAWHLYMIRLKPEAGIGRNEFIIKMAELGIGCSVHFIPLHLQPVWRDAYHLRQEQFPVAQMAFEQEVSLPLYTKMTELDQDRVIAVVKSLL